ncbi:large ribosomal subunit protein mL40 [Metopolophium dirhodum]|uniref:large ribosomal subunit protein mL40 n=1 Tax=Metopolophium dirhodum TaxID=44670 RepID=UPI00298FF58E|nr:large ribosomal subunit protein mL40 [Metopolophium dirhodum]XP_060867102.1 large ribosomal subunit protein mL40 [Metopolophium dirhodum]
MFKLFSSVTVQPSVLVASRSISTCGGPLLFRSSVPMFAEPLKKKKRLDPQILKAREDRKRKKIEKSIRKLEKVSKTLKPIDEVQLMASLSNELDSRQRPIVVHSNDKLEERIIAAKAWSMHKHNEHFFNLQVINDLEYSQQRALNELREVSEDLYLAAVDIDESLLTCQLTGPVETPPIENYQSPDGEYIDISKKWD